MSLELSNELFLLVVPDPDTGKMTAFSGYKISSVLTPEQYYIKY